MSLRVECVYAGGGTRGGQEVGFEYESMEWTEQPSSGVATTNIVPGSGAMLVLIALTIPVYVSIGASPNASVEPRRYLGAGQSRSIFCRPGSKVAWVAA